MRWWDIRLEGVGTIYIQAVTAQQAIEEAGRRWNLEPEQLTNCTIKAVER